MELILSLQDIEYLRRLIVADGTNHQLLGHLDYHLQWRDRDLLPIGIGELDDQILSFLDEATLIVLRSVSKKIAIIASEERLWKTRIEQRLEFDPSGATIPYYQLYLGVNNREAIDALCVAIKAGSMAAFKRYLPGFNDRLDYQPLLNLIVDYQAVPYCKELVDAGFFGICWDILSLASERQLWGIVKAIFIGPFLSFVVSSGPAGYRSLLPIFFSSEYELLMPLAVVDLPTGIYRHRDPTVPVWHRVIRIMTHSLSSSYQWNIGNIQKLHNTLFWIFEKVEDEEAVVNLYATTLLAEMGVFEKFLLLLFDSPLFEKHNRLFPNLETETIHRLAISGYVNPDKAKSIFSLIVRSKCWNPYQLKHLSDPQIWKQLDYIDNGSWLKEMISEFRRDDVLGLIRIKSDDRARGTIFEDIIWIYHSLNDPEARKLFLSGLTIAEVDRIML